MARASIRLLVVGALTVALMAVTPLARADSLDDQSKAKQNQIAQTKSQLTKNQDALTLATTKLASAQKQLSVAKADLATKQQAVASAKTTDTALAKDLSNAQQTLTDRQADLAQAQAAVTQGQANLAAQRDTIGILAQNAAQQNSTLTALSMLFTGDFNTSTINDRVQWSSTMFTASQNAMDQLQAAQTQLDAAEANASAAQDAATAAAADVQTKKDAAATHLSVTQQAQAAATTAEANVATQVSVTQQAQTDAQAALDKTKTDLAAEQADLADIQAQIRARIAAEKAAALKAAASANKPPPTTGTFFVRPVPGAVTSPFGMRFHPILHVWIMHQGVDFASPCAAPIYAADDGVVVMAKYYGSLGNYTLIDNGQIGGAYYSTGYGHQSKFLVSAGQHVTRGQVIGLVGTTGLSTGCHVHFNVLKNGDYINGLPLVS